MERVGRWRGAAKTFPRFCGEESENKIEEAFEEGFGNGDFVTTMVGSEGLLSTSLRSARDRLLVPHWFKGCHPERVLASRRVVGSEGLEPP